MPDFNPDAPPGAEVVDGSRRWSASDDVGRLWSDRFLLVMENWAVLPVDRCIVCDAPATGRPLRRRLSWHSPWWYLLILVHFLVYGMVWMTFRSTVDVKVGLCDKHRSRRRMWIALAWAFALVAVTLAWFVSSNPASGATIASLILLSWLSFFLAGIIGIFGPRVVYAKRIDEGITWIGGVSSEFLQPLPEWDGPNFRD